MYLLHPCLPPSCVAHSRTIIYAFASSRTSRIRVPAKCIHSYHFQYTHSRPYPSHAFAFTCLRIRALTHSRPLHIRIRVQFIIRIRVQNSSSSRIRVSTISNALWAHYMRISFGSNPSRLLSAFSLANAHALFSRSPSMVSSQFYAGLASRHSFSFRALYACSQLARVQPPPLSSPLPLYFSHSWR